MSSCNQDTLYGHDPCLVELVQTNEILELTEKNNDYYFNGSFHAYEYGYIAPGVDDHTDRFILPNNKVAYPNEIDEKSLYRYEVINPDTITLTTEQRNSLIDVPNELIPYVYKLMNPNTTLPPQLVDEETAETPKTYDITNLYFPYKLRVKIPYNLPTPEDKNVIIAIEVELYPNYENRIAKVCGLYYNDIWDLYSRDNIVGVCDGNPNKEFNFLPLNKIIDITPREKGETSIGDNRYSNDADVNNRRILFKAPLGYALNGYKFLENTFMKEWLIPGADDDGNYLDEIFLGLNAPINQIVFKFTNILDKNAPPYYSGWILNAKYDSFTEPNLITINRTDGLNFFTSERIVKYYPENTTFIKNIEFIFLQYLSNEDPTYYMEYIQGFMQTAMLSTMLALGPISTIFSTGPMPAIQDAIKNGFKPDRFFKTFFAGFFLALWDTFKCCSAYYYKTGTFGLKGIGKINTLKVKDPDTTLYKWIDEIDYLRSCDLQPENWYDKYSIEYMYSKYIKNYYVEQTGVNSFVPTRNCIVDILKPHCTYDPNIEEKKDILSEIRCKRLCSLSNVDCDNDIKKYCKSPFNASIDYVENEAFENVEDRPVFVPLTLDYTAKYYFNINLSDLSTTVYLPNLKSTLYNDICGCLIEESPDYANKIKTYYQDVQNRYKNELLIQTDQDIIDKINKEIEEIQYKIDDSILYNPYESFKMILSQRLEPTLLDKVLKYNILNKKCTFPSCAKSSYKLSNMKSTLCSSVEENCIGNSYWVPELTENDTKLDCNKQIGVSSDYCVYPLEVKGAFLPSTENYQNCKNLFKTGYNYTYQERTSYCELNDRGRDLGCIDKYNKKVAYDVILSQFPDSPELCPPPGKLIEKIIPYYCPSFVSSSTTNKNNIIKVITATLIILTIFFIIMLKYRRR